MLAWKSQKYRRLDKAKTTPTNDDRKHRMQNCSAVGHQRYAQLFKWILYTQQEQRDTILVNSIKLFNDICIPTLNVEVYKLICYNQNSGCM